MAIIEIFKGNQGYRDEKAIREVLTYALYSNHRRGCECFGVLDTENIEPMIHGFEKVQEYYHYKEGARLHHFVIGFNEKERYTIDSSELLLVICQYFRNKGIQCVAVEHYGSNSDPHYIHIHVVLNHISISGKRFYGDNTSYHELASYLKKETGIYFEVLLPKQGC